MKLGVLKPLLSPDEGQRLSQGRRESSDERTTTSKGGSIVRRQTTNSNDDEDDDDFGSSAARPDVRAMYSSLLLATEPKTNVGPTFSTRRALQARRKMRTPKLVLQVSFSRPVLYLVRAHPRPRPRSPWSGLSPFFSRRRY